MSVYELNRKKVCGDDAFPLRSFHVKIDIELDLGDTDVPARAERRIALQALRDFLEDAKEEDFGMLSRPGTRASAEPAGEWAKPDDMDLRIIKSAHRVIQEVAKRGQSGRVVLASELVGSIGLSAPTLGRLLRDGEQANDYLSRYIMASPSGRTKALDLTPEGRMMASKIRAGVVPS